MRVGIIGIGLIGGSVAIDLRKEGFATQIIGVDSNQEHASKAVQLGIVDEVSSLEVCIERSDIVIVAIPVDHARDMVKSILDRSDKVIVMDVGSTKGGICELVRDHANRSNYIAAHPIAGTEYSGPESAFAGLFKDKLNIICEKDFILPEVLEVGLKLLSCLGSKVKFMGAEEHDKHVAYVSHLSHISSFALGITVLDIEQDEKNILDLAGSGFSSTVRLAKSSPDMWTPILQHNSKHLIGALDAFIDQLHDFKTLLKSILTSFRMFLRFNIT